MQLMRMDIGLFGCLILIVVGVLPVEAGDGGAVKWRPMAIRSAKELKLGMYGGEAEQHPHGIARSKSNPDILYISHDVGQLWRSDDNGMTWNKKQGRGMFVRAGMSVEVDPVNPDLVFTVLDNAWNYQLAKWQGLYRSQDGGDSGELVLPVEVSSTAFFHSETQRMYQHLITYDPTSIGKDCAKRWYVAFAKQGLYRSEDGGQTWKETIGLQQHAPLYAIYAHPTDGKSLYLASNHGLFVSRDRGESFQGLGDLPAGVVSGLAIARKNPELIYVIARGDLYRSVNGGMDFQLRERRKSLFLFINEDYPQVMYMTSQRITSGASIDGGDTWHPMRSAPAPGLLRGISSWKRTIGGPQTGFSTDPRDPLSAVGFSHATIWRTSDGGKTLHDSSTGFTGYAWGWFNRSVDFDASDPKRFAFFCYDIAMVLTENGGMSFKRSTVDDKLRRESKITHAGMYAGSIQPLAGSKVIVASVGRYNDSVLVRSEDAGETWQIADKEIRPYLFVAFNTQRPKVVYAGDKISIDSGKSYQAVEGLKKLDAYFIDMCLSQPDTVYATNQSCDEIYRSDNCGKTWRVYIAKKKGWRFGQMDSKATFAVDPSNADVVYTLNRKGDLARFDGKRWTDFEVVKLTGRSDVRNFIRKVAVDPRRPAVIYAMANAPGTPFIFRSVDGGKNWVDITGNKAMGGAGGLVVHPLTGDVFTGSMAGTWVLGPPYENGGGIYDGLPKSIADWYGKGEKKVVEPGR